MTAMTPQAGVSRAVLGYLVGYFTVFANRKPFPIMVLYLDWLGCVLLNSDREAQP